MTPFTAATDPEPLEHNQDNPNQTQPPSQPQGRIIQVSREKRPFKFYVNLSKTFLQTEEFVHLSGRGFAVTTAVTVAEVLRFSGFVHIEDIQTSLVESESHPDGYPYLPKATILIRIRRTPEFEALMANGNSTSAQATKSNALAAEVDDSNPSPTKSSDA